MIKRLAGVVILSGLCGCITLPPLPPGDPPPPPMPPAAEVPRPNQQRASFLFDNAGTRAMNILAEGEYDEWREQIMDRQERNGDNTAWVFLANSGDGAPVPTTLYSDHYGGTVDPDRRQAVREILREYRRRGVYVVGWLTADDSRDQSSASRSQHLAHVQTCVEQLGDLVGEWCVGLEMNEDGRKAHAAAMIAHGKALDPEAQWGVHLTTGHWKEAIDWGADVLYYQFGWCGHADCVRQAREVIPRLGSSIEFIGAEYNRSSDSAEAKATGQALLSVPGVKGVGNGS